MFFQDSTESRLGSISAAGDDIGDYMLMPNLMADGAWRLADVIWVNGGANTPLRVDRCCVGLELTKQLLFRTHQPTFTAWLLWRGIGGAVRVRHEMESV